MDGSFSVELRGVCFGYRGTRLFEGLDWQVLAGEFHAVLGASGSGKTTLLRIIAGLEHPQAGSVWIDRRDATRSASHLRGVAMVSQSAWIYDHLSIADNLRFAEKLSGRSESGLQEELVGQFALDRVLGQKPGELSGGQLQRLAIVRALLSGRRLLLMDEPLSHLQESLRSPIRGLLRRWQQDRGLTCIYVTHDSQEACELSDRVSLIAEGGILQTGTSAEVYSRPRTRDAAELMGRPGVQWFEDLHEGKRFGVRPIDWKLTLGNHSNSNACRGFFFSQGQVFGGGMVVSIRQVESSRWIEVQVADCSVLVVESLPSRIERAQIEVGQTVNLLTDEAIWLS
jgi:ABC-type Fe3+/spermidine/putrescine transport system ATPase subunit